MGPARGDEQGEASWREAWVLASHFGRHRWLAIPLIAFGFAAALAETLGIGLAVMFLFALMQQGERMSETGGLLGELYLRVESVLGGGTTLLASIFFALILLNALLVYASNVITGVILNRTAERMRNMIHDMYVRVAYRYLQQREHGQLLHTLATESWTVSEAFYSLARIGVNLCAVLVLGAGIFVLSWVIGLTALAGVAVALLLPRLLSRPVQRLSRKTLAANQVLAERMLVSLTGMRTLRVFAREPYMLRVFEAASAKVRRLAIRSEIVKSLVGPIAQVGSLGVLLLIVLVANRSSVPVPTIIAAVLLLLRLQPYLFEIERQRLSLAEMSAALRDVRQTLDSADKQWPREGTRDFGRMVRGLRFEQVSFSHEGRNRLSLSDASFTIRPGHTTLIVGPSGSGKSTILNLILRLYEPDQGRITVDDIDLGEFTRESWLAKLAIAGQDVELIEGTVLQNIHLGNPTAPLDAVRRACGMVEILDDLEALPAGLQTRIGTAGLSFSGGQRQRIGLARALLREPEILLLDEATSALEPEREDRIFRRVAEVMRGKTLLVVTHRSSVALRPDDTIAIEHGRIVARQQPVSVGPAGKLGALSGGADHG